MREYIDRQATFDAFHKATCDGDAIERAEYVLRSIPLADVVEVVRCGECKHMTADGRCLEFADDCLRPSASDYCSYGERIGEKI